MSCVARRRKNSYESVRSKMYHDECVSTVDVKVKGTSSGRMGDDHMKENVWPSSEKCNDAMQVHVMIRLGRDS